MVFNPCCASRRQGRKTRQARRARRVQTAASIVMTLCPAVFDFWIMLTFGRIVPLPAAHRPKSFMKTLKVEAVYLMDYE
jgi:hypothetical protein